jgi:hypothetical protein
MALVRDRDPWHDALMALVEHNNVEPLAAFFEIQLRDLSQLVRFLHDRNQKPRGKSIWDRYGNPDYRAAQDAERRVLKWKQETGEKNIPETMRQDIIERSVEIINKQFFAKDKPASPERVREILRGPKSRRLPP